MPVNTIEKQRYSVIHAENDFEIRFYPAVVMATINTPAKSYKELVRIGFKKLVNYVFGGKQANQKVVMTTPIHMNIDESVSSVSLVIPSLYQGNLPSLLHDSQVMVKTMPDEYVAAMRFGGYASEEDIKLYAEKLKSELKANSISYYGNYQFLWYNAPYQIFGKKNEIIVGVNWNSE